MMKDVNKEKAHIEFTAEQHAMLFAWVSRALVEKIGVEKAGPVLKTAVKRYGEQRGRRMALRAENNHHKLDMLGYLTYGEWKAQKGEMAMLTIAEGANLRVSIPKCSWFTAWQEAGLIEYGKYYCQEIDAAVVRGFNPELKLEVKYIKPEDKPDCNMLFVGLKMGPAEMMTMLMRKLFKPGYSAFMPWDYHTGHLYKTVKDVLVGELGTDGKLAFDIALAEFSERYGKDAVEIIKEYEKVDFNVLPSGKSSMPAGGPD
jgi:hypothetical protein